MILLAGAAMRGAAPGPTHPDGVLAETDSVPAGVISRQDSTLDEVIHSVQPPRGEKVRYVSQITRFGFKDLFQHYAYNPRIPYTSQVNPHAEPFMEDYLQAHKAYLEKLKTTGVPYFNLIDGILSKYGLPHELKYLAVIESDLKSSALSVAGARGPWQFMPGTARNYGLKVNGAVDERTDYVKSTNAAAKYLLTLYKDFDDWLLVIAAYNGGPGRVYSAIRRSGSHNFWKLQYYLPEESRDHVKKFIATHYIMESGVAQNGFDYTQLSDSALPVKPALSDSERAGSTQWGISGKYNGAIVARRLDMSMADFNRYNPGFDDSMALIGNYDLRLPVDKMKLFLANKYSILGECVQHLLGEAEWTPEPATQKKVLKRK